MGAKLRFSSVSRRLFLTYWVVSACSFTALPAARAADMDPELAVELSRPIRVERDLVFREVDGQPIMADLYRPDDDNVYPLVMMIHGGAWSSGGKWQLADHARELAQAGFVAVSINYRLAPKYLISDQVDDCRRALVWAAEQAGPWRADQERICLWGYSAGAHLAAWIAADPQPGEPQLSGVVAGGAPCEFSFIGLDNIALQLVMGGTRREYPDRYEKASPLTYASHDDCPFFFFHGTKDQLVPASSSRKMHDKLVQLGVQSTYYPVEKREHFLTFFNVEARRAAIDFLRKQTLDEK